MGVKVLNIGINQVINKPLPMQSSAVNNRRKTVYKTQENNLQNDNRKKILIYSFAALALALLAILTKNKIKPKLNNKPTVYDYRPSTRKTLERALKGVDLTDPDAVLNALRKIPGAKIKEGVFKPSESIKMGRKIYVDINGEQSIFEVHTNRFGKNPILRLYQNIKGRCNAHLRDYLQPNGLFSTNSFLSPDSHIQVGKKGLNWLAWA